jgi:hypothetical protein
MMPPVSTVFGLLPIVDCRLPIEIPAISGSQSAIDNRQFFSPA